MELKSACYDTIFCNILYLNMLICSSIIKSKGLLSSFFSYNHFKVKLGVFLISHTFAMVTCFVKKMTISCSKMFRHVFDTIIVVTSDKEWFY